MNTSQIFNPQIFNPLDSRQKTRYIVHTKNSQPGINMTTSRSKMVHIRLDEKIKQEATEALESMGLSLSDAVRIFLTRVVAEQQIPFELKVPNAETRAAIAESRSLNKARFETAEELFNALEQKVK